MTEQQPPTGILLRHFAGRVDPESQSSGWTDLWETDQSDLWDRGQPSAPLVEWIEANRDKLRRNDGRRPRALVPVSGETGKQDKNKPEKQHSPLEQNMSSC